MENRLDKAKLAAGRRAAEYVEDGQTVGLGTGSTVCFSLERLAERIRQEGLVVRAVPTSLDTESKARSLGIPLVALGAAPLIDLTIDGADEIDPAFDMVKGGGGALLREKVVASLSRREIIVVHRAKLVERLGIAFLLPVESVPFARAAVWNRFKGLGAEPTLRVIESGDAYLTDNGNEILDLRFEGGIRDAPALERALAAIPGVVESGLFVGLASTCVIGDADGSVEIRERP